MKFTSILLISTFVIILAIIDMVEDILSTFPETPITDALKLCYIPIFLFMVVAFASKYIFENIFHKTWKSLSVFARIYILILIMLFHHNNLIDLSDLTSLPKEIVNTLRAISKKSLTYSYALIFFISQVSFFKKELREKNESIS